MAPPRKAEYDAAVSMHKKGLSIPDIAFLLGKCRQTVQRAMQNRGYDSSRKSCTLMLVQAIKRKH